MRVDQRKYVPEPVARSLRARARALGLTVSRYLATVVRRDMGEGWPPGYFDLVVGRWHEKSMRRASQGHTRGASPCDLSPQHERLHPYLSLSFDDRCADHDDRCADHYGAIRAALSARGQVIGPHDLQ